MKGNGNLVDGSAITVVTLDGVAQDYIGATDDTLSDAEADNDTKTNSDTDFSDAADDAATSSVE